MRTARSERSCARSRSASPLRRAWPRIPPRRRSRATPSKRAPWLECSNEVRGVRDHRVGAHRRRHRRLLVLDRATHEAGRGVDARRRGRTRVTAVASPPDAPVPPRVVPRRRARYIVAVGGCVIAVIAIALLAVELSVNVVYVST